MRITVCTNKTAPTSQEFNDLAKALGITTAVGKRMFYLLYFHLNPYVIGPQHRGARN